MLLHLRKVTRLFPLYQCCCLVNEITAQTSAHTALCTLVRGSNKTKNLCDLVRELHGRHVLESPACSARAARGWCKTKDCSAVSLNIIHSVTAESRSVFDRKKLSGPKLLPFVEMTMAETP